MMRTSETQMSLVTPELGNIVTCVGPVFPEQEKRYPRLRYMGSKNKLLPWIWEALVQLDFESALDLFSGTA